MPQAKISPPEPSDNGLHGVSVPKAVELIVETQMEGMAKANPIPMKDCPFAPSRVD
jgi:hypothetical protein